MVPQKAGCSHKRVPGLLWVSQSAYLPALSKAGPRVEGGGWISVGGVQLAKGDGQHAAGGTRVTEGGEQLTQ